jgi:hypothetical protein
MDRQILVAVTLFHAVCLALALGVRLGMTAFSALSTSRDNKKTQNPT